MIQRIIRLFTNFRHGDKVLHFVACFVGSLFLGFGFGIGAGLTKEWCDELYTNNWDWYDILADALGTLAGGALNVLFLWLMFR